MKKFIFGLFVLMASVYLYGYSFIVSDGKCVFAKYSYNGQNVYSDAERDNILVRVPTATISEFVDISPDADTSLIAAEIGKEKAYFSCSLFKNEINRRKTQGYLLSKIAQKRLELNQYSEFKNNYGIDLSATTDTIKEELDNYVAQYNKFVPSSLTVKGISITGSPLGPSSNLDYFSCAQKMTATIAVVTVNETVQTPVILYSGYMGYPATGMPNGRGGTPCLTWEAISGIMGYRVEVSSDGAAKPFGYKILTNNVNQRISRYSELTPIK